MTPERKRQLIAELEAATGLGRKRHRPKVVVSEGRAVRDADVVVSPADPNARNAVDGAISVRRSDVVTINMAVAEHQWELCQQQRARDRLLDPCRLGLYGPNDDDE